MQWTEKYNEWSEWKPWFAWWPSAIYQNDDTVKLVWLETIEFRWQLTSVSYYGDLKIYEYRLPPNQ